jgi:hypothetical protein
VDKYVEEFFFAKLSMQELGKKMTNLDEPAHHEYPERMMHVVWDHCNEGSKSFNSENITHYLQLIMFGCYNLDTKNGINYLASEAVNCSTLASRREYLPA